MSTPIDSEPLNEQVIETTIDQSEALPPLISPAALLSEQELFRVFRARERENFRARLQEAWHCNTPGHGICLYETDTEEHVPLSEGQIEMWIDEWVSSKDSLYHSILSYLHFDSSVTDIQAWITRQPAYYRRIVTIMTLHVT